MFYEKNVINKNPLRVNTRFALVYPNVYKTAMSSLGYQILYNYVNQFDSIYCERVIYPSVRSLETNSPLSDFDIISFSLQYEQDYFNVLKMLQEADIPLRREDRTVNDPIIIAGGPCATANPLPMSDFIDIFVVGEAEAVLEDFFDAYDEMNNLKELNSDKESSAAKELNSDKESSAAKELNSDIELSTDKEAVYSKNQHDLSPFLKVKGLYISQFNNDTQIALSQDMSDAFHVDCPIVTETDDKDLMPAFSNAILLNVSRACTRGCRFCMSSYLYRPVRETDINHLFELAESSRENTGINKVSLIGAAVSDYSRIDELTEGLNKRGFQVSTPSLRIESITRETLESLRESGLKSLTIAPESIYPLRRSINKDISDEDIFRVVRDAVDLGFNIKLYFLIGLPYECEEDIHDLCMMMKQIDSMKHNIDSNSKSSRRKAKVSIKFSVNPVIPKPHTPMQWESYDMKSVKSKIRYMKRNLKGLDIKFDSAKMGLIQYVLSCGGSDIGNLIEASLSRKISMKEWKNSAPEYEIGCALPWDSINVSVSKEFLEEEYEKIKTAEQTPWCEDGICYNCGACD